MGSNDVLIVVTAATPMDDEVVAALPERVVRDLGTAVHRCPLIEVIENPAGRFGLVDIVRGKRATTVAVQWGGNINLQGMELQRLPGHQVVASAMMLAMFAREERKSTEKPRHCRGGKP